MDLQKLIDQGPNIAVIIEGTSWRLDDTVDALVASEDWDLIGRLLVSASEISARPLVQKLVEREVYTPLAIAACMRRQPRRPGEGAAGGGGGAASRIFRDINAEDAEKGVPDYIRTDIEEMSKTATQTRASSMARDAAMDRDPTRQYIIDQIAPKMRESEEAINAMIAIARASAWDETRRTAALKVANDSLAVARLARGQRTEDIREISRIALLSQVAETFAREMGKSFKQYADDKDADALRFIAEHHPDEQYKDTARQWAESIEGQSAPE